MYTLYSIEVKYRQILSAEYVILDIEGRKYRSGCSTCESLHVQVQRAFGDTLGAVKLDHFGYPTSSCNSELPLKLRVSDSIYVTLVVL